MSEVAVLSMPNASLSSLSLLYTFHTICLGLLIIKRSKHGAIIVYDDTVSNDAN
jgi:hypothetical protein